MASAPYVVPLFTTMTRGLDSDATFFLNNAGRTSNDSVLHTDDNCVGYEILTWCALLRALYV